MSAEYPLLTVVMPVFNALPYLDEAIQSILDQSYTNFKFAIYDDCSTDGSYEMLLEWAKKDTRISVARGATRLGPCASSNAAAALADTEFVARMDADDVSMPMRLEEQVAALQQFPDAALVGSTFEMIDATGKRIRKPTPSRILGHLPPFGHSTIMYRAKLFDSAGGYRQKTDYYEDYDLYLRVAKLGQLLVVKKPLLKVRFAGQHARLQDDREEVLRKIDRLYHSDAQDHRPGEKVSIMAYYSMAVLSILGLERPHMLGEMIRNARFDKPVQGMMILGMVGIAEVWPRAARGLAQTMSVARERLYANRIGTDPVLIWSPGG